MSTEWRIRLKDYVSKFVSGRLHDGSSAFVRQIHRFGNGFARFGSNVCSNVIFSVLPLVPSKGVQGVQYTPNTPFSKWLKDVQPYLALYLDDEGDEDAKSLLGVEVDRYLKDCLPFAQPEHEKRIERAIQWKGVERLSNAGWRNSGYVAQHRIALGVYSIFRGRSIEEVGVTIRTVAQLCGNGEEALAAVRKRLDHMCKLNKITGFPSEVSP